MHLSTTSTDQQQQLFRRRVLLRSLAESTMHCIEILGCLVSTACALLNGEAQLAMWSMSALLSSALALYLLHCCHDLYSRPAVRDGLYIGMRLHRVFAAVGMRRLMHEQLPAAKGGAVSSPVYLSETTLVTNGILPSLLQSLLLPLPLPLQAAVQGAVAWLNVRTIPALCASLDAGGVGRAQFAWLAWAQAQLFSAVMAATSGSRGALDPATIPCCVSLSHLALVLEVILPVLFVVHLTYGGTSWLVGGSQEPAQQHAASRSTNGPAETRAAADAPTSVDAQPEATARPVAIPCASPLLLLLFGLGLAGVLFDIQLTMHTRWTARNS